MAGGHDNNFTILRFLAASAVIVAHAYDLQNVPGLHDPLARLTGQTMGWAGVTAFFVMSGYLIMNSLQRSGDLVRFFRARALRIFPGLAVCTVATVLLIGLFVTTVPAARFFTDPQTVKFVAGNISLLSMQYYLPGAFEGNPFPGAINGSLWTLPYEVLCYIMAAGLVGFGFLRGKLRGATLATIAIGGLGIVAIRPFLDGVPLITWIERFQGLSLSFIIGMIYACYSHRLALRWWHWIPAAGLAWLLSGTRYFDATAGLALALLVLWFAFAPSPFLRRLSQAPDYSYGIYIYAFPIQQALIMIAPSLSPPVHAAIAFVLVLIPASLSWHLIEKPALRLKDGRSPVVRPTPAMP